MYNHASVCVQEKQSGHVSEAGGREEKGEREFLSFGTNVDISDKEIWSEQLAELHKLPPYLRVSYTPLIFA